MAVSRTTRKLIESGNLVALEDEWLAELDADPRNLEYFVGTGKALAGNGEEEQAATLLELVDEMLTGSEDWETRLALLKGTAPIYLAPRDIHATILETLRQLYADKPSLEGLIEKVGLRRATDDLPKTWNKIKRLRSLMDYEVGSVVWMEGKGAGHVVEVNLELESFKLDLERNKGMRVGFSAAAKLLRPLQPGHLLRRKLEEPEEIRRLAAEDSGELLRLAFESLDRPLQAGELRQLFDGIIEEKAWNSWWTAARKHPQLMAEGGRGRQTYRWADSGAEALETIWQAFDEAETDSKLAALRKHGKRDSALGERMAADLIAIATELADDAPDHAFEIWLALEKEGTLAPDLRGSAEELIAGAENAKRVVLDLDDWQLRGRALEIVRTRRDDWQEIFAEVLSREEHPRLLDLLATQIEAESPAALDPFVDNLLSQPRKRPGAFLWLAERSVKDEAVRRRNPLRLLLHLLGISRFDEFTPFRVRLRALYETSNSLPLLIAELEPEQAARAEEAVQRAPFEDYLREPLITALHLRFPALRQDDSETLYATSESIAARRAELKELHEVEIPANRKAIQEARELGDLRENFEYKSARQRHEYLSARLGSLDNDLRRARPIDFDTVDTREVRIGTRAVLEAEGIDSVHLALLGPWESDPDRNIVSYLSDIGAKMLGKKPGDEIEFDGRSYRVARIERYLTDEAPSDG